MSFWCRRDSSSHASSRLEADGSKVDDAEEVAEDDEVDEEDVDIEEALQEMCVLPHSDLLHTLSYPNVSGAGNPAVRLPGPPLRVPIVSNLPKH